MAEPQNPPFFLWGSKIQDELWLHNVEATSKSMANRLYSKGFWRPP